MAKSKSFFGLRKGSTKTMTYSVLKGQQITKDRVTDVANPKTQGQMSQRMLFANAVKFYKHAQSAFFKFAFEDKKTKESDYNAFMRHNAKNACAVTYPNYNDPAYPAFGLYQLTEGSLAALNFDFYDDVMATIKVANTEYEDTIAGLSQALLATYPSLNVGDIVTILIVHTSLKNDGTLTDERVNRWDIRQFIVNTTDNTETLDSIGVIVNTGDEGVYIKNVGGGNFDRTMAKGLAVIVSRNTPSGLRVSTSHIIGNTVAKQFIDANLTPEAIKAAATTWGSTDKAILQGALAE